jgi:hypothetical protein
VEILKKVVDALKSASIEIKEFTFVKPEMYKVKIKFNIINDIPKLAPKLYDKT